MRIFSFIALSFLFCGCSGVSVEIESEAPPPPAPIFSDPEPVVVAQPARPEIARLPGPRWVLKGSSDLAGHLLQSHPDELAQWGVDDVHGLSREEMLILHDNAHNRKSFGY